MDVKRIQELSGKIPLVKSRKFEQENKHNIGL